MKKPTLRLRQVFEGPTHFKVVKPLGNPIKIAKKGLSPNLMGRLRKFATQAEVPEPTEQDEQNRQDMLEQLRKDIATEEARPDPSADVLGMFREREQEILTQRAAALKAGEPPLFEQPQGDDLENVPSEVFQGVQFARAPSRPRLPFSGTPSAPTLAEAQSRLGFIPEAIPESAVATVPFGAVKASDVEQAPVTQIAPPLDVSKIPRVRGLTNEEAAAATKPAAVASPARNLDQINAMIGEEMSKATPDTDRLAQLDAERERLSAPAAAPAIATTPAPVAIPAAAVPAAAAAPVAPAAPAKATAAVAAPAEKPAPVEPSSFEKALNGLGYTIAQYEAMPAPMKVAAQQAVRATIAAQTAAEAEAKALEQETAAYAEQEKALKKEADSLAASAKAARETQQKILDEYDYLKNPTSYFASLNPLQQIGTAISLAMGAFASGMTGMPNFAQKIYDNAIEQDLQAQKRKSDSLYQRLVQAGNSVNSAEDLVRAQLKLIGAAEMSRRSAQIKLPQVKAKIVATATSEALKATSEMQRIAKDQAAMAATEAERPLKLRKLEADIKIAEGTPARLEEEMRLRREKADREREEAERARKDRIAATKDKAEQERIARGLTVGTTELELKSKTGSKDVRDNIAAREQAMMSILKLESLFKREGYNVFNPLSEARTEALEELATVIEQYPKAAGFKRAISLSAAKQLKEGLQSPAGISAFVKKVLGADPVVAITGIRKEVQRSYADQVRSVVRNPQSDAVNNAILSAYAKANEEIKKYEMIQTPDESLFSEE